MRLSTEVFDAMDAYLEDNIRLSNLLATGGKSGLIPAKKPFELSVNVSNDILEVVSLSCHGVSGSGKIIDIEFDSNYSNTFDTRVPFPSLSGEDSLLLIVKMHDKQWREVNEIFSEPKYTFELTGVNSPLDDSSFPIGLVVNQYGWRLDETDYVPPCLFIDAHSKYTDLLNRAKIILKSISDQCLVAGDCPARHLIASVWQAVADAFIHIDKLRGTLSPAALSEAVQKVVASFIIGCTVDEYVSLEHAEPFVQYYNSPLDERNLYRDIKKGLDLCNEIAIKMEAVCRMPERREPPAQVPKKPKPEPDSTPRDRKKWIEI